MGRRGRNRPPSAERPVPQKSLRLRMGSETPGAITKGPPITVTCECGERHELFYGERWTCPSCGRAYDSNQIPADEYQQIRKLQLRYRAAPIAFGVVIATLALVFMLTDNTFGVFFLLPVSILAWFVFIRPTHRRRYSEAIKHLPRWDLRAEP